MFLPSKFSFSPIVHHRPNRPTPFIVSIAAASFPRPHHPPPVSGNAWGGGEACPTPSHLWSRRTPVIFIIIIIIIKAPGQLPRHSPRHPLPKNLLHVHESTDKRKMPTGEWHFRKNIQRTFSERGKAREDTSNTRDCILTEPCGVSLSSCMVSTPTPSRPPADPACQA